jgi:hypothetical protein
MGKKTCGHLHNKAAKKPTLTGFPEDEARTETVDERLEEEEDEEEEEEDDDEDADGSREWARRDFPPLTNC